VKQAEIEEVIRKIADELNVDGMCILRQATEEAQSVLIDVTV
jgi:hypothetical protein